LNCIIVGAWNTAILNPNWIAKEILILGEGEQISVEYSADIPIRFRIKIKDLYFIPNNDRLIINPSVLDNKLFELVNQSSLELYNKLPYTPITAIGHNFVYELDDDENFYPQIDFSVAKNRELYKTFHASPGSQSILRHSLLLEQDKFVILNLAFKQENGRKILDMNYHYQVDEDPNKIRHSLSRFFDNFNNSEFTKSQLIKKGGK